MANVKCSEWNVDFGVVSVRWGTCTDESTGQKYRDFGAGLAPGGFIGRVTTDEYRTPGAYEADFHLSGGFFAAGQVGSNGSGRGGGFGLGGTAGLSRMTPIGEPKPSGVNLRGDNK